MTDSNNLRAALFALLASAILSFSDNFVSSVSELAGLWQFQVFRTLFAVPMLVLAALALGISLRPKRYGKLFLRSATIAGGLLVYFATLGFLPVAQAGAGLFSSPIWVMLLSVLFLDKRIGKRRIVAMALGFLGVLLLLQPDIQDLSLLTLLPLAAGALYGTGALITKHYCQEESAIVLAIGVFSIMGACSLGFLAFFSIVPTTAESAAFFARGWEGINGRFLWLTFAQSVGAAIAVSVIAQAYRLGEPAFVSVCEYSFLVFAALWTYLLWGSGTDELSQLGIVIIIIAGMGMYVFNREAKQATSSPSSNRSS